MNSVFELLSRTCEMTASIRNDTVDATSASEAVASMAYAAFVVDQSLLLPFSNAPSIMILTRTMDKFFTNDRCASALQIAVVLSRLCLYSKEHLPCTDVLVAINQICELPIEYFIEEPLSDETLASLLAIATSTGNMSILLQKINRSYFERFLNLARDSENSHRGVRISSIIPSSLWSALDKQLIENS